MFKKKKMLDLILKEKELSKPITSFLKLEYLLIFGKLFLFIYGNLEILENVI